MKKILPLIFGLLGYVSTAQTINFPDVNFKTALLSLSPTIDLNHDGQIQVSEASAVTLLLFDNRNISDLTGIQYFTNISTLTLYGNQLTSLNVSGLSNLTTLACQHNNLASINLGGLSNLTSLNCSYNNLTTLNITGLSSLSSLDCGNNHLTTLSITGLDNVSSVYCNQNNLTALNINNCPVLNTINCNNNQLTSLDLSNGLAGLQFLFCDNNQLSSLNLNGLSNLLQAYCRFNRLTSLPLNGLTRLTDLGGGQNLLTSLDISGCPALYYVDFPNNQLTYMNLKNGPVVYTYIGVIGNSSLQFVCIDDPEVSSLQSFLPTQGINNVNINSYCSFTPGGRYNTINGTLKVDVNNNGCDASDPFIGGIMVKINDGVNTGYTYSNSLGKYTFYTNAGNYTITAQTQNPYFTINPPSRSVNFPIINNSVQTADFCVGLNGSHPDVELTIIPLDVARPGFNSNYQLVYKNNGTTALSGNLSLHFQDTRLNLIQVFPAVTTQSAGVLNWSYSNLLPFESRTVEIRFNVLAPPVNNINDTLIFNGNVTPLAGDEVPLNNSFELRQVQTGSFDPNDKTCLEGSTINITRVGDYVHYLIRFQNTGTYAATNVVVKDMLTNSFNWNSLEITKTSHPCVLKQTNGNKLEFIFENINLPARSVDEPGSHGFIAFKIKTVNTLLLGDQIKNNASIYFDFNLPVITNTATSVFAEQIIIPIKIEYFKGASQAGRHILTWKANCTSSQAIFNIERSIDGRNYSNVSSITASNTRCLQPFDFTDNNPVAGMNYYRIKMIDVDGKGSYSIVIALLNKKSGFEIVNLLPNPVVGGSATLNITSANKQQVNIIITDALGKSLYALNQIAIAGSTQVDMNLSNLPAAVYTISIFTGEADLKTIQFIKQ